MTAVGLAQFVDQPERFAVWEPVRARAVRASGGSPNQAARSPADVLATQDDAKLLEVTRPARRRTSWPLCVSPPRGTKTASRSSTTIFPIGTWLDLAERGVFGLGSSSDGRCRYGKTSWMMRRRPGTPMEMRSDLPSQVTSVRTTINVTTASVRRRRGIADETYSSDARPAPSEPFALPAVVDSDATGKAASKLFSVLSDSTGDSTVCAHPLLFGPFQGGGVVRFGNGSARSTRKTADSLAPKSRGTRRAGGGRRGSHATKPLRRRRCAPSA